MADHGVSSVPTAATARHMSRANGDCVASPICLAMTHTKSMKGMTWMRISVTGRMKCGVLRMLTWVGRPSPASWPGRGLAW